MFFFLFVDFDGDHIRDNINFVIKRIKVHTEANSPGYKFPGKVYENGRCNANILDP